MNMQEKTNTKCDAETLTDTIITNICAQLSQRNWSLKMLADKADLPYESVKKLLSHKILRPSFASIWQIANALDCSVDALAGQDTPAPDILHQISEDTSEMFRILTDMEHLSRSAFAKDRRR